MLILVGSRMRHGRCPGVYPDPTTGHGYSERLSVALRDNCGEIGGVRYTLGNFKYSLQEI